jgi:hypothetical protein
MVVRNIIECSFDFAAKSGAPARSRQRRNKASTSHADTNATDNDIGLIRWEDSNVYMLFISMSGLSVLYRNLADVNQDIKRWVAEQGSPLQECHLMTNNQLRENLSNYFGRHTTFDGDKHYVITPDNFLKAAMIYLRVTSGLPVIVMGEAGCGKTSLIRFISHLAEVNLKVISIHAGISRFELEERLKHAIISHMEDLDNKSKESEQSEHGYRDLWIFLDEINTCNELGFINSVVCHRFLPGMLLPSWVKFFCACNPYRLSEKANNTRIESIGLKSTKPVIKGGLVYQVHPLPETMLDYVWDFGRLTDVDELSYIEQAINVDADPSVSLNLKKLDSALLVKLVSGSQKFMRRLFGGSCVSMRDVRRVKYLLKWFLNNKCFRVHDLEHSKSCILLSLTLCYRCRLENIDHRNQYDIEVSRCFQEMTNTTKYSTTWIEETIFNEQMSYLDQMYFDEDAGIAKNTSLTENVFVLLICILTKTPVFLVGKPGSSKSLAMTLIASNLRGRDSRRVWFKRFPEIKVISFQGSESSTSDGIIKIFEKAEAFCRPIDDEHQIIPVVLLDEVGLAEISPHNPLKVLHSRLETEDDRPLNVAVVGISNWDLDASKMSRAIQLSRPEPSLKELRQTAFKIIKASCGRDRLSDNVITHVNNVTESYHNFYTKEQATIHSNFHGLRDFYSCFKCLGSFVKSSGKLTIDNVVESISRNFGGHTDPPLQSSDFRKYFTEQADNYFRRGLQNTSTVRDLVIGNLKDPNSRHLMLIANSDALLSIASDLLKESKIIDYRVIIGSKFHEDQSDDYRYRTLSEIILSMERGESVVLYDIDSIYGSLYDMLNQKYTVVAGKKNCRVALGAYSNPMAHVHDDFKCVVIVDVARVQKMDPPLLNRFEKQYFDLSTILSKVRDLQKLFKLFSCFENV